MHMNVHLIHILCQHNLFPNIIHEGDLEWLSVTSMWRHLKADSQALDAASSSCIFIMPFVLTSHALKLSITSINKMVEAWKHFMWLLMLTVNSHGCGML